MNQHSSNQNSLHRIPKMESSIIGRSRTNGAPQQNISYVLQPQQQPQPQPTAPRTSANGKTKSPSAVTIEELLSPSEEKSNNLSASRFDEEKLPLFLIKLWNIVEDPNIQTIVHWDESGASFHIADPYSFCRNVLPHYFKHNNLNSLIRQLNMYGFRKMTPLNQGGLTRTESDQDHLEFSHPYFVQNHPELLSNIKRKQSARITEDKQVSVQTQHNLELVMNEVRALREKQRSMEAKMNSLTKENGQLWDQMTTMRQHHNRQQHVVKKLFQFLISVMQPGIHKRVNKRGVLAIDDHSIMSTGASNSKRPRNDVPGPSNNSGSGNLINTSNLCEMIESLQRELHDDSNRRLNQTGPLIAEVTDDMGHSPNGSSRYSNASCDQFGGIVNEKNSHESTATPIVSATTSSKSTRGPEFQPPTYFGSGALTTDNVVLPKPPTNNCYATSQANDPRKQPKRSVYKGQQQNNYPQVSSCEPTTSYQSNYVYNEPVANEPQNQLVPSMNNREDNDLYDINDPSFSPTLVLSPSLNRQISMELQDYLNGVDFSIDSCRDLLNAADLDNFGEGEVSNHEYEIPDYAKYGDGVMNGNYMDGGQQLALENVPASEELSTFSANVNQVGTTNELDGDGMPPMDGMNFVIPRQSDVAEVPIQNPQIFPDERFEQFDPSFNGIREDEIIDHFPNTPELLTPGSSPSRL